VPSTTGKTIRGAARNRGAERAPLHADNRREWLAADPAHAATFLAAALETGDPGDLMQALRDIADARGGIAQLAEQTGLRRETLYRTLSTRGNPQLSSLLAILKANGLRLTVSV